MSRGLANKPAERQNSFTPDRQQNWPSHASGSSADRDRDKPLSFHWRIDIEELRRDVPTFPHFKTKRLERAAAAIVADALQVLRSRTPRRRISYSRSHDWYSNGDRYRGSDFTYVTVVQAIAILVDVGILIDHDKRPPTAGGSGIQSSFRGSAELAGLKAHKVSRARLEEVIVLKDSQKHKITYKDTVRTRRARKEIQQINDVVSKTGITIDAPHALIEGDCAHFGDHTVYLSMKEGYRVWNNGVWSDGGRLYGTFWQQMKSEDRQYIMIGGRKTVELDYAQLHPRMMYAKVDVEYEGDAYAIPGWTNSKAERDLCKRGWNVLLNSKSWKEALMAMANYTDGCEVTARELLTDIRDHHHKIRRQFHTGAGLKFQAIDGDMCIEILKEMNVRRGIVCLSVHDSFIVAEEHRQTLTEVMATALLKALSRVSGKACAARDSGQSILHTETPPPHLRSGSCSAGASPSESVYESGSMNPDLRGAAISESFIMGFYNPTGDHLEPETNSITVVTSRTDPSFNPTGHANTGKKAVQCHSDGSVGADTPEYTGAIPRACSDGSLVVRQ